MSSLELDFKRQGCNYPVDANCTLQTSAFLQDSMNYVQANVHVKILIIFSYILNYNSII